MDLLDYTFFRYALLAGLVASVVCGMIGTYIVTRRMVFISGGITHSSFGGVGIAMYLGMNPLWGAALFALLSAAGVQWLGQQKNMREDSAIAVFWALGMAVGVIFSFLTPGYHAELSTFLFGNILTVTLPDIYLLCIVAALVGLFFLFFINPIIYVAFDREFARSQNLPVALFEYVMILFVALAIVACLRLVGIVLVLSMLTLPQMTANLFTNSFRRMIILSVLFGFVACAGGLAASFLLDVPSGATIIIFSILLYMLCKATKSLFRGSGKQ